MPATWQAGDTAPPIRFTITEADAPVHLEHVTIKFRFGKKGGPALWERECEADDADVGTCHLAWEADDLATSGDYEGQLVLVYAPAEGEEEGRQRLSAPFDIRVERSLAVPAE